MATLTERDCNVLEAYRQAEEADPQGAFAPYYHTIAAAADGDAVVAYNTCKALKKAKLLDCDGRQGAVLINAPAYWITDAGKEALAVAAGPTSD